MTERHTHQLAWLRPEAPYAPFVQVGLLAVLRGIDASATVHWQVDDALDRPVCVLTTAVGLSEVGEAIASAPWPDLDALPWPNGYGQAIKPVLGSENAVPTWRQLVGAPSSPTARPADPAEAARRHVGAIVTDGALDAGLAPSRSRLIRGVKADLSAVVKPPRFSPTTLQAELLDGPTWKPGSSGLGLGLVPEVQTFGGVTGPKPDSVGAYSVLLYALCWHAIAAMPSFGALRPGVRAVGSALASTPGRLRWPIHTAPTGLRAYLMLLGGAEIGAAEPDRPLLRARGILALYESQARDVNSMIAVFGWGDLVG